MATTAQSVILRCVTTLQDVTSVRWPVPELIRYLNDGQRQVALERPDATDKTAVFALAAGPRQVLPVDATKLLEIRGNTVGSKRAVRLVNREILDAQIPGWYGLPGVLEIIHYMYDPRDATAFHVYPPANGLGGVNILYSALPVDLAEPAPGTDYTNVVGNISVADIHANALADYILYRAYTKDAEYAGNLQRAAAHQSAFSSALNTEIKTTIAVGPSSPGSPNGAPAG